jgi:hypothetical protein
MAGRHWCVILVGLSACGAPRCVAADDRPASLVSEARDFLYLAPSRLYETLSQHLSMVKRDSPEWLREQTQDEFHPEPVAEDAVQLVVQQDRRDGTDLLTLRYPLGELGDWRTYAGGGLNQVVYFADADSGPTMLMRRNRHRSMGAAAEIGAEWRASERWNVGADLRWVEIDPDASLLRSEYGLVGADAFSVGVSVGWRFR